MHLSPFIILCGTGFFAIFSSTASKSPVLPLFAVHLGASPVEVGLVAAVSTLSGILFSIPAGVLSDRWGRKTMLLASGVVFASAPLLYPVATGMFQLGVIRLYHGLATAIFVPVAMAYVSELHESSKGEKLGWFSSATLCGRFLAPVVGGGIMALLAATPSLSYGGVYLICAVAGLIALLTMVKLPAGNTAEGRKPNLRGMMVSLRSMAAHPGIMLTGCVEGAILFAYGAMEVFLPLYARTIGLGTFEVGLILAGQVVTLAVSRPAMGRFSDRHGRAPQIVWGGLVGAVCIGMVSLCQEFAGLLAVSVLFGLSLSVVTSATSAAVADMSQCETRGSAMGVFGTVMDIGHSTGSIVCGLVAGYFGFRMAFLGAALVLFTAAVMFWLLVSKRKDILSCSLDQEA